MVHRIVHVQSLTLKEGMVLRVMLARGSSDSLVVLTHFVASQMNHWESMTIGQIPRHPKYSKILQIPCE